MPTVEYVVCIYIFIYLFIYRFAGSTVQSTIVYGVNLFTMPGMQRAVYAKSSKVLAAISCCLLLIYEYLDEATLEYSLKPLQASLQVLFDNLKINVTIK